MLSSTVKPISPAAGYLGGKRNLSRLITGIIDAIDPPAYFEPFVGMGGIFLRRRRRAGVEAINDRSGDVATFFRVLQEHYPYFIDMLRWRVSSRAEFERLAGLDPDRLTDLQRAARFLYLQRLAFGGRVSGRTFGVDNHQGARFNVTKLEPLLADIHERLAGVWIERLPYEVFIRRWDRDGALFYLDPPYFGCEGDYGPGFQRADFEQLADQLAGIRGRFILSLNDTPEVRACFSRFVLMEVETTYSVTRGKGKRAGELLISDQPLG